MTCPMLAAIAIWERHDVQPAAAELFGRQVERIDHFGTYACRNVNNEATGRRSEHARANAIDVAAFTLDDGETISVLEDWDGDDAKADFLHTVRDGGCKRFSTVLGPDYNAAHANHFHLDMGRFGICR